MSPSTLPWPQWLFYVTSRWGWRALFHLFGGLEVRGLENLPCRGPIILAPNNVSLADPWIVCAGSPNPLRSLASHKLYEVPGLAQYLYAMGAIPLRRGVADHESLGVARELLAKGATVMIFPEGGSAGTARPGPGYRGWLCFRCAAACRSCRS